MTTGLFRLLARARRAPAFHPDGIAFRATVDVAADDAGPALPTGTHAALIRFSRGLGWRRGLPDVHGVAVRLPDLHGVGRHQDLLLSSVASPGVGRMVPWPSSSLSARSFSTVAPYRAPGGPVLVGARFTDGSAGFDLSGVEDVVWSGRCRLELLLARRTGPWRQVASVTVHADRLTDDEARALGFDPWNTADGFVPVGLVNRVRRPAYEASRAGRPGTAPSRPTGPSPTS
jgi:hypothetical protein